MSKIEMKIINAHTVRQHKACGNIKDTLAYPSITTRVARERTSKSKQHRLITSGAHTSLFEGHFPQPHASKTSSSHEFGIVSSYIPKTKKRLFKV